MGRPAGDGSRLEKPSQLGEENPCLPFKEGEESHESQPVAGMGWKDGVTMPQLASSKGVYENQSTNVYLKSILSPTMATTLTEASSVRCLVASALSLLALESPLSPTAARIRHQPDHVTPHPHPSSVWLPLLSRSGRTQPLCIAMPGSPTPASSHPVVQVTGLSCRRPTGPGTH